MPFETISGAPVSRLTFGAMQFGGTADDVASRGMYDAARAAGVNHFDTAHTYTGGASEKMLGGYIAGDQREDLLISSKVGYTGGAGKPNMLAQFEESRQRLQLDMIDVIYLHRFDPNTDLRETLDAFSTLQQRGQIRFIGLSNFAAWQVMKAQSIASNFDTRVAILQPMYSLVKRQVEVEILPMCEDQAIEVAPYSPLGGGLLTGKYAAGGTGRLTEDDRYAMRYGQAWMHEAAVGLTEVATDIGVNPASLAVAWTMAHTAKPRPIISARNAEQLKPSLTAMDIDMTPGLYERLSALSPQPAPATDRLEEQQCQTFLS